MADLSDDVLVPNPQEVLAALPEIIVQVDAEAQVRSVNRPESSVFRRVPVPGDLVEDIFELEAATLIASSVTTAQHTGMAKAELDVETDLFRLTAKRLESAPLTMLVFEDITNLRQAGHTLMDLIRDKSSFLASVGHELRTPLTAVIGYANMLSQPDPSLDEATRRSMVRDMTDQAWDLAGIVEDLLTVARTEIGELRVVSVPVNVTANTAQVIESMGDRGSHVTVRGDWATTGVGDPGRFRQIVRNLLRNALTHGSAPVTVEVSANATHAMVLVKDHGPGIADSLVETIFEQYVTASDVDAPDRVGIGLWISRELASLMGGHLTYRREQDQTVFEVTIPLSERTNKP